MSGIDGIEGKHVTIFYDDLGHISRKEGILTRVTESDYWLDDRMIIPKARVIRVELKRGIS